MTAQEFLDQGYMINDIILLKQSELDMLRLQKDSITSPAWRSDITGRSPSSSAAYEYCIQQIEHNIDVIILRISELTKKNEMITSVIERIPDLTQQSVLMRRYISFQRFRVIAEEMKYSERQIYNIHADALKAVQDILDHDQTFH